jgi:uncharacterized protein involved in type VI secretion and phage assembly
MSEPLFNIAYLKINGSDASAELMDALEQLTVESSLHLPDMLTLSFYDPGMKWIDDTSLALGTALVVDIKAKNQVTKIFDGEIVELELEAEAETARTVVRAFDRLHRLARGRTTETFVQVSDADLAGKIAQKHGLSSKAASAPIIHPYVIQHAESDLEFLQRRAAGLGRLLFINGRELHFEEPAIGQAAQVDLSYGQQGDLLRFRSRLSTLDQVNTVKVHSWDIKQKQAIVGQATTSSLPPAIGEQAKNWFSSSVTVNLIDCQIITQNQADKLAASALSRHASRFAEAEGLAFGNPKLLAGVKVKISNVGTRLSGTYFVTSATHRYSAHDGYLVEFSVSGVNPAMLISALLPAPPAPPLSGLMPALVSNINDPDGLGRIKVVLPWMGQSSTGTQIESDWARVAVLGGGTTRGFQFIPEVNDEVLVGFLQNDPSTLFIIGGLWNGKDKPPLAAFSASGAVTKRMIQSRTGHQILLDDDDTTGGITITDKAGNKVVLKAKDKTLAITSVGDMTITSAGKLTIKANQNILIESETAEVKMLAKTNMTLEATSQAKLSSNITEVEGKGQVQVKGAAGKVEMSGLLELKGSLLKLN